MKIEGILFGILLLSSSCLKEEESLKMPFATFEPIQMNDGWMVSSAEDENLDAAELAEIYTDFHTDPEIWQVRSLLVFRNGYLIAESYTKDDQDIRTPRAIWSATKQVIGLLTGIALEKQIIQNINDPISDYLVETVDFPDKSDITIEHLLTMRSGISYSNDGLEGQTDDILRQLPEKVTGFILGLPLAFTPGEQAVYKDCDPQLVSSVIQSACGKSTAEWAREVLFDPLGISILEWDNYKDGITLGGFGILTTPREMAKIGQCVMDSGEWKGKRIVSKEWIKQMTTAKVEDLYGDQFGYLWWIDSSRGMTMMNGHGGQYFCIIPSKNLIVVMTAEVNTQGYFQFTRDKAFLYVDRITACTF